MVQSMFAYFGVFVPSGTPLSVDRFYLVHLVRKSRNPGFEVPTFYS